MNDDRVHELERELADIRPAPLPAALLARLETQPSDVLEDSLTAADRVLAAFSVLGAMAACVVVGLTVWQLSISISSVPAPGEIARPVPAFADFEHPLAAR